MMAADHQVHIVFFNRIDQHLAKVAAAAQGLGDGIACVGRELGQRVMGLFGDAFLHVAEVNVNQPGVEVGVIHIHMDQGDFRVIRAGHRNGFFNQYFTLRGQVYCNQNMFVSHSVTPSISLSMTIGPDSWRCRFARVLRATFAGG